MGDRGAACLGKDVTATGRVMLWSSLLGSCWKRMRRDSVPHVALSRALRSPKMERGGRWKKEDRKWENGEEK